MKRLVLAGGGHAHLQVLEQLARDRPAGWEIVLLNPTPEQFYSGMIPAWIAGEASLAQCTIPLRPLAAAAGARWVEDRLAGVQADDGAVRLAGGGELAYDLLSLNVGAATDTRLLAHGDGLLQTIKPLSAFTQRWAQYRNAHAVSASRSRLVVVGGGAGGVEIALAARQSLGPRASVTLVAGDQGLLPEQAQRTRRLVRHALRRASIACIDAVAAGERGGVRLGCGRHLCADLIIAATGSQPPQWVAASQLESSSDGYVAVDAHHRSVSHPNVWAVGDICQRVDLQLAHSGVHAVHAGAALSHNLCVAMRGKGAARAYRPRRWSLYLIRTGPRRAVASYGPFAAEGAWAAAWKRYLDNRFVERFTPSTPARECAE